MAEMINSYIFEESMLYIQTSFDFANSQPNDIQELINRLAESEAEERGAVFTKREVVEFILDLVGYRSEEDLTDTSLLEPCFGTGDFLLEALKRLLDSYFLHGGTISKLMPTLKNSIRGIELHKDTFVSTKREVLQQLLTRGITEKDAIELSSIWLVQDDFLLTEIPNKFTYVVGNPPYVRQDLIPDNLISIYRKIYKTIFDRADLYIPFIERSLSLLSVQGKLGFICSDRWMKNRYGGPLRELISKHFHLQYYIDMVGTEAFRSDVTTYPAIIVLHSQKNITMQENAVTQVVRQPTLEAANLHRLATAMQSGEPSEEHTIQKLSGVINGSQPWLMNITSELTLLRHLEEDYPLLEEEGCKVGIGVATGCDSIFIGHIEELPIEEDRKLPLAMAPDIKNGNIEWSKKVVINPFQQNGKLINLEKYPRLKNYFIANEEKIKNRNVAKKNPHAWYRTIDKIDIALTYQPKLFIPDIKDSPLIVYDAGHYYPHHNLYYAITEIWDIFALKAVLQSLVAKLFIITYSVKMRGGYLRFQAQNLRRIHLPAWSKISDTLRARLRDAAISNDIDACNTTVFELYGLSSHEQALLYKLDKF